MPNVSRRLEVAGYDDYLREWRALHGLEPDRMRHGFLDTYLRLPYAIARPLARRGASPDLLTLYGLVVTGGCLPAYLAGGRWPTLGVFAILLGGLCDQLDGCVGILTRRTSAFGAVWDSTIDRLTDALLLLGPALLVSEPVAYWGLAAAGTSGFLLEYVRARCQAVGYVTAQVVTPAERPTRVVVGALMALGCGVVPADADVVVSFLAWGLTGLSATSVVLLLVDARRRARGSGAVGG